MNPESNRRFLFTSESVGKGHPDKICDQISDAVVDKALETDPFSRVAIDTVVKSNLVMLVGEITTKAVIDYEEIVRNVLKQIGYTHAWGLDPDTCTVLTHITQQSQEISSGVEQSREDIWDLGAGDQGLMFGYATDETEECMPQSAVLAHELARKLSSLRETVDWLGPDSKTQVTMEYTEKLVDGLVFLIPERVHTIVISTQHKEHMKTEDIREFLIESVIKHVIPEHLLVDTKYVLQPSGRFVVGGPKADSGLTGRKIIVDSYGGWCAHGGGAYSGKDWSKVDRTGAYLARWISKSLVKAGICKRVLVQISYAIGVKDPLALYVDTYGTSRYTQNEVLNIIHNNWNMRLGHVVNELQLYKPIYQETATFGHFGKGTSPWEMVKSIVLPEKENGEKILAIPNTISK
ncbi:S-adenosylmethionine synthetase [Nematocida sp. LUAm3]|nr:S-adenosylmethionine synthetase [Nematocida sp. LUAm3]KAI5176173.1 S-adenosylmethionine synthetase [Nematocida sp. LUAm2]KAI5179267.1 S-adenosylmethionine synthetase [Nematocida sp. LUAm1]